MRIHGVVESGFAGWGRLMVRWHRSVVLLMVLVTTALAAQLPNLRADNSTESFLRPDDPARVEYDRFRAQFGQDQQILVAVRPAGGVFTLAGLEKLRALHRDLERGVPFLEGVTSLWNARNTRGEADELIVEDLLVDWPESEADVARVRLRVEETPLYHDIFVNRSGTVAALVLEPMVHAPAEDGDLLAGFEGPADPRAAERLAPAFLSEEQARQQIAALGAVLDRHRGSALEIHAAGGEIANFHLTDRLLRDSQVFMGAAIGVVALLLFVLFRRASAVLLPILTVQASLVASLGTMAWLDVPTSVSGQVMPALIFTVGICSAVHVLAIVYQRMRAGESRERAIPQALQHSGLAVAMATLTTAAGLVSFRAAELAQIADVGLVAPLGILWTFVYAMTLLPALLAWLPLRPRPRGGPERLQERLGAVVGRLGGLAARRPWPMLWVSGGVVLLLSAGVARLQFSQDVMRWFPSEDPVRMAADFVDREFGGAGTLEFVIDTGRENGLHDPDFLRRLERAGELGEGFVHGPIRVGKAVSLVDVLKETHRALHANRNEFYALPEERRLAAQELLLFENAGSDDLEDVTDSRFQLARLSLRVPLVDAMHYPAFIAALEGRYREVLGEVEIENTGVTALFARTFHALNTSMARSYVLAILVITPMMVLLIGDWKRGLLSMIPNLAPIAMTLGLMGWLGIHLDNSTLLVGCVLIGLAVDDTIHFMHKFQRYLDESGDAQWAVRRTLETTGAALLFTTLVIASGFAVMLLAYMRNATEFAALATFAALVAFLADILIAPALMVLTSGNAPRARQPAAAAAAG